MKTNKGKRILAKVLYTLPLIALAAFGGYYYMQYNDLKNNPITAEQAALDEVERYKTAVGELYDLPSDEEPELITVVDKELLAGAEQEFFKEAENGDIALVYRNARLAILYRPSTKKLINVNTLTVQDTPSITVVGPSAVRGTVIATLANSQITATEGGNSKTTPKKTIVIDLTGNNADTVKGLANILSGDVADLPTGEVAPEGAEILIIVSSASESSQDSGSTEN